MITKKASIIAPFLLFFNTITMGMQWSKLLKKPNTIKYSINTCKQNPHLCACKSISSEEQDANYRLKIALATGTDVNKTCQGRSLLHHAVATFNSEKVDTLLTYGANPDNQDNSEYETPLIALAKSWRPSNLAHATKIAEKLFAAGADPFLYNLYGNTVFGYIGRQSTPFKEKLYVHALQKHEKLLQEIIKKSQEIMLMGQKSLEEGKLNKELVPVLLEELKKKNDQLRFLKEVNEFNKKQAYYLEHYSVY